jgi:alanyl-tRNA synthetase
MTGSEIREKFLQFFKDRGHAVVASSSLIPKDDPTLLFTNSGMVQFKNLFLGKEDRGYRRAASSQKSVRAGGKHNDLENVGYTARHHTFFEMLGNFSFGDYFKKEAIEWAWDFLTGVMGLPKERMLITIYRDDDEAFEIWNKKMGIPADRIFRLGEKDNFWMMGETGPCGPCSEIIYDQGPETGCGRPECSVECDCDRFLELWNLVFTQFDRDAEGKFHPLPKPNIDTGMGLERLAAVIQGVKSNYECDLFREILQAIGRLSGRTYGDGREGDVSMRVIADHCRSVTFLIGDGILPSNEGRGYVLRRILRRAARHGKLLGMDKPFLHDLVPVVIEKMKNPYSDLPDKESYIRKVVFNEEQRFMETLDGGLRILNEEMERLRKEGKDTLPGGVVFKLYDTFGFPTDLTADAAKASGFGTDMAGFEKAMEIQREKARESWKGSGEEAVSDVYHGLSAKGISNTFVGYEGVTEAVARVTAILRKNEEVPTLREGENGEVFVDTTPFYGEVGGQIGDAGIIEGSEAVFDVWDTQKPLDTLFTHIGKMKKGELHVGDTVVMKVDVKARRATEAHHSGTHILQAALKQVLGDHVKQSGSLVNTERLRFDFTHFSRIEDEEMERVERIANAHIRDNEPVVTRVLPKEEAFQTGATAVFDEKYGDEVRLVQMGDFSKELCGGTHVRRTGDLGFLKVLNESSVAAGVRRIEAVTGEEAVKYFRKVEGELRKASALLKTSPLEISERVDRLLKANRELEKEIAALKGKLAARESTNLLDRVKVVNGVKTLAAEVAVEDVKALRDLGDKLRDKMQSGVLLLGGRSGEKAMLLCMVTKDLTGRFHAGNIVKAVAPLVGGTGGGRPDMAQAGGGNPDGLPGALSKFEEIVRG